MEPAFTLFVRTEGAKKVSVNLSEAKDMPVSELRRMAASHAGSGLSSEEINLMYCGKLLRDEDLVSNVGLKAGSTVHALRRPRSFAPPEAEPRTLSDAEMRQFFLAFSMAIRQPALNVVFRRLTEDRDNLESLAVACQGLASDHTALALLSKPEMLLMLLKPEVLQKAAKEHPALIEAMQNLAAAVHEERPTPSTSTNAEAEADGAASSIAAPFAYAIDDMSDGEDEEEDHEMEDESGGGAASSMQRNRSFPAFTSEQLALAIAAAQNNIQSTPSSSSSSLAPPTPSASGGFLGVTGLGPGAMQQQRSPSTSSAQRTPSSPAITADMFRQAMAEAVRMTQPQSTPAPAPAAQPQNDPTEQNVQLMKDMGIIDEGLARKALRVMGGDLQAAIDLILSGWLGEDE